jgi:superfamily II DNA/RNA helicase
MSEEETVNIYDSGLSFEQLGVPDYIQKGLLEIGWYRATYIQKLVLEHLHRRGHRNLIAQSHNGTGKTGTLVSCLSVLRGHQEPFQSFL